MAADGEQPTPHTDPEPPDGPGGPDAVPDWEGAGPDAVVPDAPRSAQVEGQGVPHELDEPEPMDEADGAGSHPEDQTDAEKETPA